MLYFIAVWTGLFAICLTVGCGSLHWLHGDVVDRPSDRAITSLWLGLVMLAVSMLAVAIFVPVSPLSGVIVTVLWLLLALKSPAVRVELSRWISNISKKLLLGYSLCAVAIAAFISQPVTLIDTGQYHYGFIQWLARYGITPGLALINPQFGFVSAWFAIAAPFDFAAFAGRVSPVMNGFILLVAAVQMALSLNRIILRQALLSDWFSLVFLLSVCGLFVKTLLLSDVIISPSADSAIALLTVAVTWSMLVVDAVGIDPAERRIDADLIPLLLSVGAVSIKLTALPLLAITAGFYLFNGMGREISLRNCLKRLVTASSLILLFLLPLLASQVLVSGCPLYPSTIACLDLPWTPPASTTQELAEATHGWGKWFKQPPDGVNQWLWLLQQWAMRGQSSKLTIVLIFASVCSIAYLLTFLHPKNRFINQFYSIFWLAALAIVGTTFMMLKAPLFRLGMSYVLLLPVLSVSVFCHYWAQRRPGYLLMKYLAIPLRKLEYSLLFVGVFWAIILSSRTYGDMGGRLFIAPPLPTVVVRVQESNQINYFVSQDRRNRCWAAALPCVKNIRSEVELRNPDTGLQGGFILSKGSGLFHSKERFE